MLDGIVYLLVNHLLIIVILVLCLRGQTHHAITQE